MKKMTDSYKKRINKKLAEYLRRKRKWYELSQEEMGELLGLNQSAITRIEQGKQKLTAAQMCWLDDEMDKSL